MRTDAADVGERDPQHGAAGRLPCPVAAAGDVCGEYDRANGTALEDALAGLVHHRTTLTPLVLLASAAGGRRAGQLPRRLLRPRESLITPFIPGC